MFVRGRVEHHLGSVLGDEGVELGAIADAADDEVVPHAGVFALELVPEAVQGVLVVVEQHDLARAELRELADELGADRPSRARDEHGVARDVADRVHVEADEGSTQQVLDLHVPQPVDVHVAREDLGDRREDPAGDAGLRGELEHLAHPGPGGGRHRDQDLVHPLVGHDPREVVDRAEHGQPREHQLLLHGLVVEEPDRFHPLARVLAEVAHQLGPRAPGPHQEGPARLPPARGGPAHPPVDGLAHDQPPRPHEQHRHDPLDQRDGSREPGVPGVDPETDPEQDERPEGDHLGHVEQVGDRGLLP